MILLTSWEELMYDNDPSNPDKAVPLEFSWEAGVTIQNGCLLRELRALIDDKKKSTIMWEEKHALLKVEPQYVDSCFQSSSLGKLALTVNWETTCTGASWRRNYVSVRFLTSWSYSVGVGGEVGTGLFEPPMHRERYRISHHHWWLWTSEENATVRCKIPNPCSGARGRSQYPGAATSPVQPSERDPRRETDRREKNRE